MQIAGTGAIGTQPIFQPAQKSTGGNGQASGKTNFQEFVKGAIDNVNQDHQASETSVKDLLSGGGNDVLPAVQAMAKADMSFKLLIGVRNKMIEAYKQTMNMQV